MHDINTDTIHNLAYDTNILKNYGPARAVQIISMNRFYYNYEHANSKSVDHWNNVIMVVTDEWTVA